MWLPLIRAATQGRPYSIKRIYFVFSVFGIFS